MCKPRPAPAPHVPLGNHYDSSAGVSLRPTVRHRARASSRPPVTRLGPVLQMSATGGATRPAPLWPGKARTSPTTDCVGNSAAVLWKQLNPPSSRATQRPKGHTTLIRRPAATVRFYKSEKPYTLEVNAAKDTELKNCKPLPARAAPEPKAPPASPLRAAGEPEARARGKAQDASSATTVFSSTGRRRSARA